MSKRAVIPLESNPEIFNELSSKLGLSPVLGFHDVYSLTDPDLLGFIPQPVYGLILLFPLTSNYENYRRETDQNMKEYGAEDIKNVQWFKQTIKNGCGLYALIHLLMNLPHDLMMEESLLSRLGNQLSVKASTEERAKIVEGLEEAIKLDEDYGSKGQTEAPDASDDTYLHFITFVKGKDNNLYELDGRRKGPTYLGGSESQDTNILNEASIVNKIQFYINNADERNKHNFAIMAVAPTLN